MHLNEYYLDLIFSGNLNDENHIIKIWPEIKRKFSKRYTESLFSPKVMIKMLYKSQYDPNTKKIAEKMLNKMNWGDMVGVYYETIKDENKGGKLHSILLKYISTKKWRKC